MLRALSVPQVCRLLLDGSGIRFYRLGEVHLTVQQLKPVEHLLDVRIVHPLFIKVRNNSPEVIPDLLVVALQIDRQFSIGFLLKTQEDLTQRLLITAGINGDIDQGHDALLAIDHGTLTIEDGLHDKTVLVVTDDFVKSRHSRNGKNVFEFHNKIELEQR